MIRAAGARLILLSAALASAACGREAPAPASTMKAPSEDAYRADVEQFRQALETKLTSDTGWLTIAGLAFLTKPRTTFGSDPANDIVLPGATPPRVGTLELAPDGNVSVTLEPGSRVTLLDGRPFGGGPIKSDREGAPDRMVLGDVQLWVHRSGDRPAVRIRDRNNPLRRTFGGRKWYPVDEGYRVQATFEPYDMPQALQIPNLLGDIDTVMVPGRVRFSLHGTLHTMLAVADGDELWFIFRDGTSGQTTYPAARFLYTARPVDGQVVLDFNRAESPPCAFNPFATCPLPPQENRLTTRVEAGEQYQVH